MTQIQRVRSMDTIRNKKEDHSLVDGLLFLNSRLTTHTFSDQRLLRCV